MEILNITSPFRRNLKSLGLPKDEMRILSGAFCQEYSKDR